MNSERAEGEGRWGAAQWLVALAGLVVGWMLDWLIITTSVLVTYSETGSAPFLVPLIGVPVLSVVAVLLIRSVRVPFLIGLAVGTVAGSGACVAFMRGLG